MRQKTNSAKPVVKQEASTTKASPAIATCPSSNSDSNPDFVLVWNNNSKTAQDPHSVNVRNIFETNLQHEGLIVETDTCDTEPSLHVVKIWAPLEILKRYSETLNLKLPMKKEITRKENTPELASVWAPLQILKKYTDNFKSKMPKPKKQKEPKKNRPTFCERIEKILHLDADVFAKKSYRNRLSEVYSVSKEDLFDVNESNMCDIYPVSIRSLVVKYILRRTPYKVPTELEWDDFAYGYERLIQKGIYEAAYPLHDGNILTKGSTRQLLYDNWGKLSRFLKYQPLDAIKDYFGVNIALYYAWLGFYTRMLVIAAVFGVLCILYGLASYDGNEFVKDVCNSTTTYMMCPLCGVNCGFWDLHEKCDYAKLAHIFDNDVTVLFAIAMSVWTAIFLEFWKRYSATITDNWDLSTFDVKDLNPRPEYVADIKRLYPIGTKEIPFWRRKLPFSLISYSMVLLMVVLAIGVVIGVIVFRLWFFVFLSERSTLTRLLKGEKVGQDYDDVTWEESIVSVSAASMNLAFILLFKNVYKRIAEKLTDMEYPRTQPEFDASYTFKIYLLEFVNNYSSIFYVAFFKGAYTGHPKKYHKMFGKFRQEACGISCMPALCIQLAVIMLGNQIKSMLLEGVAPVLLRKLKRKAQNTAKIAASKDSSNDLQAQATTTKTKIEESKLLTNEAQWVQDYDLLDWGNYSLADEYLEMVIQFGFVTIFVVAFPLAPLFALLNNIFELRTDASKMLKHYRRPVGIRVHDIGVWSDVIDGVVKLAVLSNACIIALTSNFVPRIMYRYFLSNPNHGTLIGYLEHSLTSFNSSEIESKPKGSVVRISEETNVCFYKTYRYNHTFGAKRYEFNDDYWKIWLARVVFVIVYENFVGVMLFLLCWIIPDVPKALRAKRKKDERLRELKIEKELQLHALAV